MGCLWPHSVYLSDDKKIPSHGPRDDHTKWSKPDRQRQISHDITYMWNLKKKMIQMNLLTKQKQTHKHRK